MAQPACFTCRARPAGNGYGGPYSAYCAGCQPRDTRPQPRGSQCGCAACGRIFATVTDFERHQERHPRGHPQEGVFTGRCSDPASLGLEEGPAAYGWAEGVDGSPAQAAAAACVWGTPEGNANRARLAARLPRRGAPVHL